MPGPTIGEQLLTQGWRSGSVIPVSMYGSIGAYLRQADGTLVHPADGDWLIVVSQSCDIVARSDAAEPYVEILLAHDRPKPRSQFIDLRSTRWIDFRPNRDTHPNTTVSAHATADRYYIPRQALLAAHPDTSRQLSSVAVQRLNAWFSLRYGRPAWPESFVTRITKEAKDILDQSLITCCDDIVEVRVVITPSSEAAPEETHKVTVWFVMDGETFETDPEARASVTAAYTSFTSALRTCAGIEIDDDSSKVVPGNKFTWQETRASDLWDFANLSPFE